MIYFDNAATTPVAEPVKAQVVELLDKFANPSSRYAPAKEAYQMIYDSEKEILELLGADPKEYNVYFTSGATEANNWAISSFAHQNPNGCAIIASGIEHPSVHNAILKYSDESNYCKHRFAKTNKNGIIDADDLLEACFDFPSLPKMVSVMAVNNQLGTVQPIEYIGALCGEIFREKKLFHVDATQAVGHTGIDLGLGNIDMLSASAHKFGGLKGTGFLVCKKDLCITPMIVGGKQNKNRRAGTENVIGIVTTATALRESLKDLASKQKKICEMKEHILSGLIPGSYEVNGSPNASGILNISLKNNTGDRASLYLEAKHIYVSTTSACESRESSEIKNRILEACGFDEERIRGAIRISLSADNTKEECDELIKELNYINEKR